MNPNREEALFAIALEKPANKRAAFLVVMCEGDRALRARLGALLAAHEQPETLLATQAEPTRPTLKLDLADGQQREVPIIYGEHLRDHNPTSDNRVAWVRDTPAGTRIRLFETVWENDRPDMAIESLDFISRKTGTEPLLFAITVEPEPCET